MFLYAAQTKNPTAKIYVLLEDERFDDAFSLATEALNQFEGLVDFDLAYGLAAKSSGNCSAGLFALERVVQTSPQNVIGRFALANCYLVLGNLSAAATEFIVLNKMEISPALRKSVGQAQSFIKRNQAMAQGGWQNSVHLNTGFDSNPNNGVEDEFITVPLLGQIRLFEQSRQSSSTFYELGAQFSYFKPLTQYSMWYASLGGTQTDFFDDIGLSQTSLSAVAGYTTRFKETELDVKGFYRPLRLDGNGFLNYYGISGGTSLAVFSQSKVGAVLTLAALDYANLAELNREQTWLEVWFEIPTFRGSGRITAKVGNEKASVSAFDFNSRNLSGFSYRYTQQIDWQWFYSITFDYLKAKYSQAHPLFAKTRDDTLLKLAVDVNHQLNDDWVLNGRIGLFDNASNITLYQYDRSSLWLGARYQF
jgi:hypothetical protein